MLITKSINVSGSFPLKGGGIEFDPKFTSSIILRGIYRFLNQSSKGYLTIQSIFDFPKI